MSKLWIILPIVFTPFVASFHPFHLNSKEIININSSIESTLSLKQFRVISKLGDGAFGDVYLVEKDGDRFALKAINITHVLRQEWIYGRNFFNSEREMLEAARDWPWATGLQYAWREGNWLFLAIDYVAGGSLLNKIKGNRPNSAAVKLILAELVSIIEALHKDGVLHLDVQTKNILIDSDGHLVLADFGMSKRFSKNAQTTYDWEFIHYICDELFSPPLLDQNERDITQMFHEMVDEQLPVLKSHPYFDGIDWDQVAARKFEPPFEPMDIQIKQENPIDLMTTLQIDVDEQLGEVVLERLCNYTFVAPGR